MDQLEAFMATWNRRTAFTGVDVNKGDIWPVACFSAMPFVEECSLLRGSYQWLV
jgi:hypothetical protein